MGTRSAIYVKKGDETRMFYRHWDGYPDVTGVELMQLVNKHDYDFDKVCNDLSADEEHYRVVVSMPNDVEFEYTLDCHNKRATCFDRYNKQYFDEDGFYFHNPDSDAASDNGLNPVDGAEFCNLPWDTCTGDSIFDILSPEEIALIEAEMFDDADDDDEMEWKPRYPIDMENPADLSPEQIQRGDKLFDAVVAFMDEHPEIQHAPMLCITQEWDISVDLGGYRCDSDFVDSVNCVMCHDEEGWYADREYMRQCVPYLEKELKESADFCLEMDGEIPSHRDCHNDRVATMQLNIMSVACMIMESREQDDVVIAVDTITQEVYGWPVSAGCETYGGIIQFYSVADLSEKAPDGTLGISINKIESVVKQLTSPRR